MLPKPKIIFHPYFRKIFLPFLAVLVLVAGLGVSLNVVRQRQTSTKASTTMVDLSISAPTSLNPNQEFSSTINVDPHAYKVTAIDLKINVSPNLQIMSIQPGTYLSAILSAAVISGNSVHIVLGSGTTPAEGAGILATLTLKAKSDATGTAQITVDSSTAVAGIDTNGAAVPTTILGTAGQTNITINSTTPTSNPFGIMTWGNDNSTKMQIATDLGAKYYRPLAVILDNNPLSCTECQAAIDKGLKLVLTIRANGGGGVPTVPTTDWITYRDILSQVLDKYQPELLVIENEENSNTFYTGTAQQYLNELTIGCEVAHSKNIKCANGGLVSKLVDALASNTLPTNDQERNQITRGQALLAGYKSSGADFVNFHWYVADTGKLSQAVSYLATSSGLPVMTNEIGQQGNTNISEVTSDMQKILDLNLPYAIWFNQDTGTGGDARALTDKNGTLRDNGKAYQQFIKDHFGTTPTPTPATPSPTPLGTSTPTPTPTPTAAPTPTPTPTSQPNQPNSCNGTCGSNPNCQAGLFCSNGFCRNPFCSSSTSCVCPTPLPALATPKALPAGTPTPFVFPPLENSPEQPVQKLNFFQQLLATISNFLLSLTGQK